MLLGGLAMGLTKIRLGDYIERSTENNSGLKYGVELITGVNSQGVFAFPKGNTQGVDLKPYKIVKNGAFVYNPTRLDLGSLAYRTEGLCIVSHLYMVFYLNEKGKKIIDPMYLYMYFQRREFCREVTFRNFGSQRPEFNFNDMSDIVISLPDIETQQKYVDVYNAMLANQRVYELGLDDLKLTCDAYIEQLKYNAPFSEIGKYISPLNEKNVDNKVNLAQGVNIDKVFIPAKRIAMNTDSTRVVRNGQFAYNKVMKSNGTKLPIALREGEDCYVSGSYQVFEVTKKDELLSEYLMMWLSRDETQRYAGFISWGSTRDVLQFDTLCEIAIPIPDIKIQQYIVNIYTVYQLRREINEQLKSQIKDLCPILIKGSLEEAMRI